MKEQGNEAQKKRERPNVELPGATMTYNYMQGDWHAHSGPVIRKLADAELFLRI